MKKGTRLWVPLRLSFSEQSHLRAAYKANALIPVAFTSPRYCLLYYLLLIVKINTLASQHSYLSLSLKPRTMLSGMIRNLVHTLINS